MSTPTAYVTIADVARRLGVGRTWARVLVDEVGIALELPGVRARLVHRDDLDRLVAEREAAERARSERAIDKGGRRA